MTPVIACTDRRAVVFGYAKRFRPNKRGQIELKEARMCLYWPDTVGGVFGLGQTGPDAETRISATLTSIHLEGVTAIFDVTKEAARAWLDAPTHGAD